MSIFVLTQVWDKADASGTKLLVLLSLADTSRDSGVSFPHIASIAAKARCDEKTVRRVVRELQESRQLDIWEWYDKRNGHKRNCYRILIGDLAAFRGMEPDEIKERAKVLRINVPTSTRRAVFERDGWRCVDCESKIDITIDHVIPVAEGGGNEEANLVTRCAICNARKGATLPDGVASRSGETTATRSGQNVRSGEGRNVRSARDEKSAPTRAGSSRGTRIEDPLGAIAPVGEVEEWPPQIPPVHLDVGRANRPLNALLEECGIDGESRRVALAAACLNGKPKTGEAGIRDLFWIECVRYAEARDQRGRLAEITPEEFARLLTDAIHRKAALYRERMPNAMLAPRGLADHWLDLNRAGAHGGRLSRDEVIRHLREGQAR